jgi:hypothetical protein
MLGSAVLPRQRLRWQLSKQIAVPTREATQLRDVPSVGHAGYCADGLGFPNKFVTYAMQPQFLHVRIRRLVKHNLECAMKRPVRGCRRVCDP